MTSTIRILLDRDVALTRKVDRAQLGPDLMIIADELRKQRSFDRYRVALISDTDGVTTIHWRRGAAT